jgi:hypothetical protein
MRKLYEGAQAVFMMIGSILLLATMFVGCGAVRQQFSFSECEPGKPDMGIPAILWSGVGVTTCTPASGKR